MLGTMVTLFAVTPMLSYAKDKDKEKNENSRSNSSSCIKAFGHLIAPGYIKIKGEADFRQSCFYPFGINKKIGGNASSTPDTLAPIISNVSISPKITTANIVWKTNERSNSTVFWSLSTPVNTVSASSTSQNKLTKDHKLKISGLVAGTAYHFVVRSTDVAGNVFTSNEGTFTTKTPDLDAVTPIISNVASLAGSTTINVSWKTNEQSSSKLFYSTVNPLVISASTTNFVSSESLVLNHALGITGLATGTPYSLVIQSKDSAGNITTSPQFTSTTTSGL